ncbi:hypothetical protein TSOC_012951 [Tetrabaena socialis]|uniref:Uncharacterized protein n=1 Tax=Tetrabaena socialis TaxID=47790 RepID=A0A2J7ZLN4_9CHLO|nr:hypothetical protein TSOC_012951 [Tetrabaena socialis]|eukprot:PNH01178.1 hypothetical protein TSOC_012951 [Tetrabaena socialis]
MYSSLRGGGRVHGDDISSRPITQVHELDGALGGGALAVLVVQQAVGASADPPGAWILSCRRASAASTTRRVMGWQEAGPSAASCCVSSRSAAVTAAASSAGPAPPGLAAGAAMAAIDFASSRERSAAGLPLTPSVSSCEPGGAALNTSGSCAGEASTTSSAASKLARSVSLASTSRRRSLVVVAAEAPVARHVAKAGRRGQRSPQQLELQGRPRQLQRDRQALGAGGRAGVVLVDGVMEVVVEGAWDGVGAG